MKKETICFAGIILTAGLLLILFCSGCQDETFVARIGCQNDILYRDTVEAALSRMNNDRLSFRMEIVFDNYPAPSLANYSVQSAYAFCADPEILAVIGYGSSDAALAAAEIFNREEVVQIVPNATSPELAETGPWTFKLLPDDRFQSRFLAGVAKEHYGAAACAVIYQNNDYGRELAGLFSRRLEEMGGAVTFQTAVGSGLEDSEVLEMYASEIIEGDPDLLVFMCRPRQAGLIMDALDSRGAVFPLLGSDAMGSQFTIYEQPHLFRGMRVALFYHHSFDTRGNQEFVATHRQLTGQFPDYTTALVYDAVFLLQQAFQAGARTRKDVRQYLEDLGKNYPPFHGVCGKTVFDENRACRRPLYLGVVKGKEIALMEDPSGKLEEQ